ncbi:hypothetical protein ABBQ32_008397 [Trebouxia sp. C0010 RCD-2024]
MVEHLEFVIRQLVHNVAKEYAAEQYACWSASALRHGHCERQHGNTGKRRNPTGGDVALAAFMNNLIEMEAEPRPENDDRFLNPSRYPTIRAVYDRFLEDYAATHQQHGDMSANVPMSEDTFRRKFKQCYPHVKIPKTNRFAQCDVCFLLRGKMELAPSKEKKKLYMYRKQLHLHHKNVSKDKAVYYSHRSMSFNREKSESYGMSMIIIVDGMSKWKTMVPHFAREPKSLDS